MAHQKIEKAMNSAKANLALEGMTVSEQQEELVRAALEGRLSNEDFIEKVKKLAYE
ncbi:hypothetical protein SAMN05421503_2664 [Terribacillus aidingensis]|uniref:Antitoxin VbhA domain-containing protein n=1 Tax=Terribacillus aidingensis TaxID=586416 RepID=A0A285P1F4_9BACI|nr:antitoxin VbhA family protein [Terribacillus aidingensis]SNZ15555.1 hypothetical protein SAMN05421503_2664 [Terribacillus aidingensis]